MQTILKSTAIQFETLITELEMKKQSQAYWGVKY